MVKTKYGYESKNLAREMYKILLENTIQRKKKEKI
jgi:hypothetical protein